VAPHVALPPKNGQIQGMDPNAFIVATAGGSAVVALGVASAWASAVDRATSAGILKMTAATGYILLAFLVDATSTSYGRMLLPALVLCWIGDLLLINSGRGRAFLGGLGSFLLGHVAFAAAFYLRGIDMEWSVFGGLAAAVLGIVVFRWIIRHDPPTGMRIPVGLYVVAITVMVAFSLGTFGASGGWMIPVGALTFMVSDVFVARERFVASSPINVNIGLPLYFLGQVFLVLSGR
jgi:uncharacterized membrane protein YhhN